MDKIARLIAKCRHAESRLVRGEYSAAGGRDDNSRPIAIDTLGKLAAHRHGVGGYCLDCRRA